MTVRSKRINAHLLLGDGQHGSTASNPSSSTRVMNAKGKKPHRTQVACSRCRSRKLRCDGQNPCMRCQRAQVTCLNPLARTRTSQIDHTETETERSKVHVSEYDDRFHLSSSTLCPTMDASTSTHIYTLQTKVASLLHRVATLENTRHADLSSSTIPTAIASTASFVPNHSVEQSVRPPFSDMMEKGAVDSHQPSRRQSVEFSGVNDDSFRHPRSTSTHQHGKDHVSILSRQVYAGHDVSSRSLAPLPNVAGKKRPTEHLTSSTRQNPNTISDPICSGLLTSEYAESLLDWFMDHCHPFLPVLDVERRKNVLQMRQEEPFLLTVILAISARHVLLHRDSRVMGSHGQLLEALTHTAEAYLGQTLTRSRFHLSDVQATLFLHAWGLRPMGSSSDPWILSGHAFRLSKRLTIDKTVWPSYDSKNGSLAARRTWLLLCASDCFPSLGFGRPASPKENLDLCHNIIASLREQCLVQRVDIGPDAFVAAQGELAQISRKLLDWVVEASAQLNQGSQHGGTNAARLREDAPWVDCKSIWARYKSLSGQLKRCDSEWNSGLTHPAQRLCASLYRWHVRLCLPTFALRLNEIAAHQQHTSPSARSGYFRSQNSSIDSDTDDIEGVDSADVKRYDCTYRRAVCKASEAIIALHACERDAAIAHVPDYLVMALAQAAIAFVGLLDTSAPTSDDASAERTLAAEQGVSKSDLRVRAASVVASALASLERLDGQGATLARSLSARVVDVAQRGGIAVQPITVASRAESSIPLGAAKRRNGLPSVEPRQQRPHPELPTCEWPSYASPTLAQPRSAVSSPDDLIDPTSSQQNLFDVPWSTVDGHLTTVPWFADFNADDPLRLLFGDDAEGLVRADISNLLGMDSLPSQPIT